MPAVGAEPSKPLTRAALADAELVVDAVFGSGLIRSAR